MLHDLQETKDFVKTHEGYRNKVYYDTLGYATIGVGHKVQKSDAFKAGEEYPEAQLMAVYDTDFHKAYDEAKALCAAQLGAPGKEELVRIITCLVFQMGKGGVSKFRKMWAALKVHDYDTAAHELLDSRFARQAPERANQTAALIRELGA